MMANKRLMTLFMAAAGLIAALGAGCNGGPPATYPVTGKVTLGGKPYERLIVYFRPAKEPINGYNLGVGETDKDGVLHIRATETMGLAAGEYKVTFTYRTLRTPTGTRAVASGEKPDEVKGAVMMELVPESYRVTLADETTPVRFVVKPKGDNVFEFDIPVK